MSRALTVTWILPVRHRNVDRMPASVWIRCLQLLPYLERHGIRSVFDERPGVADVMIFVRRQDDAARALACSARGWGARVVVDFCVNYFDDTGLTPGGYGVTARHVAEAHAMVEVADLVTAASSFIASRARTLHDRVEYVPDSVDRTHFNRTKVHDATAPLIAMWCGYSVKAAELEPILPLLAERSIPLMVVSDARPRLSIPFEFRRWRHASAPADLIRGDVALAPRDLDNRYNLGHSFFRIGVFLAQGVPVVAGPVPSYGEVLTPGENGLSCSSEMEWKVALDALLADRSRLSAWSARAVQSMEPYWAAPVAARYAQLLHGLVDG